jgi:hypothetical protein
MARNGTPGGADFEFDWRSSRGSSQVAFYAAGNAANSNGNSQGDLIYTTNLSVDEAPPDHPRCPPTLPGSPPRF